MKKFVRIIISFTFIVLATNQDFDDNDDEGTSRSYESRRRRYTREDVPLLNLYPHFMQGNPVASDPLAAYRVMQLLHPQTPYTIGTPSSHPFISGPVMLQSHIRAPAPLPTQPIIEPQSPTTVSAPTMYPNRPSLGDASSVHVIQLQMRRVDSSKSDNVSKTSDQEPENRGVKISLPSMRINKTMDIHSLIRAFELMERGEAVDQPSDIGSQVPLTVGETDNSIPSRPRGFGFMVIKFFRGRRPTSGVPSSISPIQETIAPSETQDDHLGVHESSSPHVGHISAFLRIIMSKFGLSLADSEETDHEQKGELDHTFTYQDESSHGEHEIEHDDTQHGLGASEYIQRLHESGIFGNLPPRRYRLHDVEDDEHHYDRDEDDRSSKSSTCEECTKDYKYFYCASTRACIHRSRFLANSFTGKYCPIGDVYYYNSCTVKSFVVTFFIGLFFLIIFSGIFATMLVMISRKRSRSKLYQRLKDKENEFKKGGEDVDAFE